MTTDCGHDAFLLPNELAVYGGLTEAFLSNLQVDQSNPGPRETEDPGIDDYGANGGATSIYRHHRLDYDSIVRLIPPGASVLDLGCGGGGLLARLREQGHDRLLGVELDEQAILACVRRGLDVVQLDLNRGLGAFADGQFDFVVLSQTLPAVTDVKRVLADMLRVGRQGIVSFPNLAYARWRAELAEHGRAPQVGAAEGFHWYDTPNVRLFSISDFEQLCAQEQIRIDQRIALNTESNQIVVDDPNLAADIAVFSVSRQRDRS